MYMYTYTLYVNKSNCLSGSRTRTNERPLPTTLNQFHRPIPHSAYFSNIYHTVDYIKQVPLKLEFKNKIWPEKYSTQIQLMNQSSGSSVHPTWKSLRWLGR
jgi:hypothetical protein